MLSLSVSHLSIVYRLLINNLNLEMQRQPADCSVTEPERQIELFQLYLDIHFQFYLTD